jgi:RIO kinase 2
VPARPLAAAPELVKARVRAALEKKRHAAVKVRRMAKGEASAKTRTRRDNRQNIAQTGGSAVWDD